jgi:hypothetical protein
VLAFARRRSARHFDERVFKLAAMLAIGYIDLRPAGKSHQFIGAKVRHHSDRQFRRSALSNFEAILTNQILLFNK